MIKYPNGQKTKVSETKSPVVDYKNRGLHFEEEINLSLTDSFVSKVFPAVSFT